MAKTNAEKIGKTEKKEVKAESTKQEKKETKVGSNPTFVRPADINTDNISKYLYETEETAAMKDEQLAEKGMVRKYYLPFAYKLAWMRKEYPYAYFDIQEKFEHKNLNTVRFEAILYSGERDNRILGKGYAQRFYADSNLAYMRNFVETAETAAKSRALNDAGFNLLGTIDEFSSSAQQKSAEEQETDNIKWRRTTQYAQAPVRNNPTGKVKKVNMVSQNEIKDIPGVVTQTETEAKVPDMTVEEMEASDREFKDSCAEKEQEEQNKDIETVSMTPYEAWNYVLSDNGWHGQQSGMTLGDACQSNPEYFKKVLQLGEVPKVSLDLKFGKKEAEAIITYIEYVKESSKK